MLAALDGHEGAVGILLRRGNVNTDKIDTALMCC